MLSETPMTETSPVLPTGKHNILALIPAYNESERISPVVLGSLAHLPVLVVDDGSRDNTVEVAESAGAIVLRQVPNQGKGAALRAGFQYALNHGFEAVITLDADGQHDPWQIPLFLKAYTAQTTDLIIGARDFTQMPPVRRLANTLGKWLFSWAVRQTIADNQSGYRLISRRLMEAVLDSDEQGFEFEVEMIVVCVRQAYSMGWVPIRTIYGGEKSHIRPGKHVANFVRVAWRTRQSLNRRALPDRK